MKPNRGLVLLTFPLFLLLSCSEKYEVHEEADQISPIPYYLQKGNIVLSEIDRLTFGGSDSSRIGMFLDLVVDSRGSYYVADGFDGTVKVFDRKAILQYVIRHPHRAGNRRLVISAITNDEKGSIYVSDVSDATVYRFDRRGVLVDSLSDNASVFVMGYVRVSKSQLFLGVLEKGLSMYGIYKSTMVGIYDWPTKRLLKRFGSFDEMYRKLSPLSPEVHFDIDGEGNVYLVQANSFRIFCYSKGGDALRTFGQITPEFKIATYSMPREKEESAKWRTTWSNMNGVRVLDDYIIAYFVNLFEGEDKSTNSKCYLNVYSKDGTLLASDIRIPGRLLCAAQDILFIGLDLKSDQKQIALLKLTSKASG
ncbi:MAG: hypothetical protein FJ215_08075 [Ignavibacteria bacterium]|nr:hypothetical protein [Ignavibacteria bacterium]